MKLAGDLGAADYEPESVRTVATVRLDKGESGFAITGVDLDTEARVPGIDPAEFEKIARAAKDSCPVSGALAAIPITLRARLSA